MKRICYPLICLSLLLADAGTAAGQSKEPLNTLPRYGGVQKPAALRKLDQQFVSSALKQYHHDRRAASESCVSQGWSRLYDADLATSMKRFNQAWLLDSTNCNVYYGFSACLSEQGLAGEAHKYYMLAQHYDVQNQGATRYHERLSLYYQSRRQPAAPRNASAV